MIWWIFTLITLIDFYFFRAYINNNIAYFYPINFDQSNYLALSYSTFEHVKINGFISGIRQTEGLVTGLLFPIQAILLYFVFGASRFISLLPNFLYFVLLQLFSLIAVRSISKKLYISLLFLAFIILINVPFRVSGGLMDFRMDFIAFCLYGMVLASAVKSKLFLDLKWSFITVVLIASLILLRFITAIYMLSIFWPMTLYYVLMIIASKEVTAGFLENKVRLKHITLITLFLTAFILSYVFINKDGLYDYYMVGHFLGNEKLIRANELATTNFLSIITFYPKSIFNDQLGQFWFKVSLLSLLLYFLFFKHTSRIGFKDLKGFNSWGAGFIFFLLSLIMPLIILTIDVSKSRVVGSIMVMPILWLIMWCYLYLDRQLKDKNNVLNIMAFLILIIGFSHQIIKFHQNNIGEKKGLKTITSMYLDVGDYATKHHWTSINLSVDQVCDYFSGSAIEAVYYEIRGKIIPVKIQQLGRSIFAIEKNEVVDSLKNSNVIMMNLNEYTNTVAYPFNITINRYKSLMKKYTASNFHRLGDYQFMNSTYRVFVK